MKILNNKNLKFKIGLQFPDELLNNSIKINALLKHHTPSDCVYFILADTSYGNCCVDVVAAEHYNADSIVHFGHSCLSPVDKMPIFYVFDKHSLNLGSVFKQIESLIDNNPTENLILIYDVSYYYLYGKF